MSPRSLHDHLSGGHDNNLLLIRMLAALMVLASHTFALSTGMVLDEPWRMAYGHTPGTIAVEIFFLISGLLLTHSLTTRRSLSAFAMGRALRIYPGLIVAVLTTSFLVLALASPLQIETWLTSRSLWHYIITNASGVMPTEYHLPGAFISNPMQGVVNGSLWSLRWEIGAYIVLAATWGAAQWLRRAHLFKVAALLLLVLVAGLLAFGPTMQLAQAPHQVIITRVIFMLAAGAALSILARHVKLTHGGALIACTLLMAGVWSPKHFTLVYTVTLPYLLAYLAFVPQGFIRHYNRLGDYSYGTYLYAFPLQQLVVALNPGISNGPLMLASWLLTMLAAVASWHGVEKPAMAWQRRASRSKTRIPMRSQALKAAWSKR
jgi:peptidoglycan/LPS O-acetylase OafA/YrhL